MILSGIRILDLTRLLPGPFATQWLVAMGAEVIRVEPPNGGDWLREMPPFVEGMGAWFTAANRGKKSVAIDLKQPEGRELFLRLVRSADGVVEGFRPGVMARLGLAPELLLRQQPRLIYASLTGYGAGSRWRERAGHDLNYLALAGFLGLNGPREGPPMPPAVPVADFGGAMALVIAVLAGLFYRERTGRGVVLDASIFEVVVTWMQPFWRAHRAGLPAAREGMPLNGALPCYRVYVTADGGGDGAGGPGAGLLAFFLRSGGTSGVDPPRLRSGAHPGGGRAVSEPGPEGMGSPPGDPRCLPGTGAGAGGSHPVAEGSCPCIPG